MITKATDYANHFTVRNRNRVSSYYTLLWVWHRLDEDRWNTSSIQLREGRKRNTSLDVDHTIADAWWKRKINEIIENKLITFAGSEEEKSLIAPDEFNSRQESYEFINSLGNCSLLEKSFNISKNDKTMKSFLSGVHEFTSGAVNIDDWEKALSIYNVMTDPTGVELQELVSAIKQRDALIRINLIEFINGTRFRTDINE